VQVNPSGGRSTGQAAGAIKIKGNGRDPAVEYVEPNFIYHSHQVISSDDPFATNGSLWGMYSSKSSPDNYGCGAVDAWAAGDTGDAV
jgi:hypothetical protein